MNVARAEVETARLGEPEEEGASDLTRPDYPDLLQSPPGRALELVEERPLGDALALLRAHLDVARREKEDPVGHRLDIAVERVRQAGAEINHPAAQVAVDVLEVQNNGLLALEAVREVLGVVEAGGRLRASYAGRGPAAGAPAGSGCRSSLPYPSSHYRRDPPAKYRKPKSVRPFRGVSRSVLARRRVRRQRRLRWHNDAPLHLRPDSNPRHRHRTRTRPRSGPDGP